MSLSQLDVRPALIVVDLQKGIVGLPLVHPSNEIIGRAASLAQAFRAKGYPVVLVNVAGIPPGRTDVSLKVATSSDWSDLVPELNTQASDYTVTKTQWGAFHGTELYKHLIDRDITQVFLCGIATSIGVESTARHAHEHGLHVVLVTDSMTDVDPASHWHSITKIFPLLGETTNTEHVLSSLNTKVAL